MHPTRCIFQPSIGGTGLQPLERLIRFVGHPNEIAALLHGGLSLSQAIAFADPLEAAHTEADDRWISSFYQKLEHVKRGEFEARRQAMLATAYVSCWHRLTEGSDISRMVDEYVPGDFRCVVATTVTRVLSGIQLPNGTPMWLDLFPVRYLESEEQRLQDALHGEFQRCGYPPLEFKRPSYAWEQEARFVMHDDSATAVYPGARALLGVERPGRQFASIFPESFFTSLHALNEQTASIVESITLDSHLRSRVERSTISDLRSQVVEATPDA